MKKSKEERKDELKTQSLIADVAISEYIAKLESEIESLKNQKKELSSEFDKKRAVLMEKVKELSTNYCKEEQDFLNESFLKRYGYEVELRYTTDVIEENRLDFSNEKLKVVISLTVQKATKEGKKSSIDNNLIMVDEHPHFGPIFSMRRLYSGWSDGRQSVKENQIGIQFSIMKEYENLTEYTETKNLHFSKQSLETLINKLQNEIYDRSKTKEKIELKFKTKLLESDSESKELLQIARDSLPTIDSLKKQLTKGD